jgi:hypothetical protein
MTATLKRPAARSLNRRSTYRFRGKPLDKKIKAQIQELMHKAWACWPVRCRLLAKGLGCPVEGIRDAGPVRLRELLAAIPVHLIFDEKAQCWTLMKYSTQESMDMVLKSADSDPRFAKALPPPYDEEDDAILFAE